MVSVVCEVERGAMNDLRGIVMLFVVFMLVSVVVRLGVGILLLLLEKVKVRFWVEVRRVQEICGGGCGAVEVVRS